MVIFINKQSHSLTGLVSFESSNGVVSRQYCFQPDILNCDSTRIIFSAKMLEHCNSNILVFNTCWTVHVIWKNFSPGWNLNPGWISTRLHVTATLEMWKLLVILAVIKYTICLFLEYARFTPQRFYIKNRILEYSNQTLYLIERITRVLGPNKALGLPRVLGPLKVLSLPRVMSPPRVLDPPRVLGPYRVLGPRSFQGVWYANLSKVN